ncbi:MAG: DNA polymerase III subunit beta [Coriobacteriia bacterium]|jgi:DNA polymerase III subunit beta|nr:DNA polymerase III subunit beta [Coriobacteriia bacterium]
MRVSCLQENLNRGLGMVGRSVAVRSTLPVVQNILIVAEESRLKLVATNLEMATTCWVGAKVEEVGSITVPARLLSDFVTSLPNELVQIEMPTGGRTVQFTCGRFQAHINGIDAEEFPPVPEVAEGITAEVDAEGLREGITRVAMAAATDESRPVLTGISVEFEGERMTLAAADGFRLAVYKMPLARAVEGKTTVIVPARTLNEIQRLLGEQEEPVHITVNDQRTQAIFRLNNAEIVTQLVQGTFPNYSQVIPSKYDTRAVADVGEFTRVARMASAFARDASNIVRLLVTPGGELKAGKITLTAQAEEIGGNTGDLDALVDGNEAKIAFNVKYLMDVLAVVKQSQVALEVTTPSSPGVVRPIGTDNYVHVIMPMFVQW